MKLKSYLRGLGLGIVVTTLILVIAFNNRNKPMTDAQIMSRAYELGMVEETLYGNKEQETAEKSTVPSILDDIPTVAPTIAEPVTEQATQEVTEPVTTESATLPVITEPVSEPTTEPTTGTEPATSATSATVPDTQVVTVVLENITSASMASTLLYEAGIIDDVKSFNDFLTQQGWATRVSEGTFEFKKGMTYEEVGKIITRQK